ncbi:MAG: hypothetical protein V7L11_24010 [Nostoc sp.]|uniref:hypothetical protein n=1 Tax=Nostoc sp. TaxID=1180 RepID=UPI002FF7F95D
MDSGLQIDNVQSFVKVIGNNHRLWILLFGRYVKHTARGRRGRVSALNTDTSEICVNFGFETVRLKYKEISKYKKEIFIKEFNEIFPPFYIEDIFQSIQMQKDAEVQEAARQEAQKIEVKRQESAKLKAQIREIERLKFQKQEVEKIEIARREAQIQESKRRELQRWEEQKWNVYKQALIEKLKDSFEQNFLSINTFYKLKCTEYISFEEYQAERSSE